MPGGEGGGGVGGRAHQIHQSGPRPQGGGVKAGGVGLRAGLAIGGQRGVNQPAVQRRQIGMGQPEFAARRAGQIGHEDIGAFNQLVENRPPFVMGEVQTQPALAAIIDFPGVVAVTGRHAGHGACKRRQPSPAGASILITSAPKSAKIVAATGAAI